MSLLRFSFRTVVEIVYDVLKHPNRMLTSDWSFKRHSLVSCRRHIFIELIYVEDAAVISTKASAYLDEQTMSPIVQL